MLSYSQELTSEGLNNRLASKTHDTSVAGRYNFLNAEEAESTSSGSIRTTGGVGIAKSLFVGGKTTTGSLGVTKDLMAALVDDAVTTGENASLSIAEKTAVLLLNNDLESILEIAGGLNGKILLLSNGTGRTVALKHTADEGLAGRIISSTESDIAFKQNSLVILLYSSVLNGWLVVASSGGGESGGGILIAEDYSQRNEIPEVERTEGMLVYVSEADAIYKLIGLPAGASTTSNNWEKIITSLDIIGWGGQRNHLPNPDGSLGVAGWTEGYYAADTRPNGSFTEASGSDFFFISSTTTNPLNGKSSLIVRKDSISNPQGRAIQSEYNLPLGARGKNLDINLNYIVNAGTFTAGSRSTDSDMIVWVSFYDGSSWSLKGASSFNLLSNSSAVGDTFSGTVQAPYNATKMRLILFVTTTNVPTIFELKLDASVSISKYATGTPITDWVSWTPTGTWLTNSTYTGRRRQVGDEEEFDINVALSGAPTSATLTLNLPVTIDTAKLLGTVGNRSELKSFAGTAYDVSATSAYSVVATYNSTTEVVLRVDGATGSLVTQAQPFTFASGDSVNVKFSVPVVGRSSSVKVSDGYDGRQLISVLTHSGTQSVATATTTKLTLLTVSTENTYGGNDTATQRIYIRSSGYYEIDAIVGYLSPNTTAGRALIDVYANGASIESVSSQLGGVNATNYSMSLSTRPFYFSAGTYIELYSQHAFGASASVNKATLSVRKCENPTMVASGPVVVASYTSSVGTSVGTSATLIPFATLVSDSHGRWNGNAFTVSDPGFYDIMFMSNSTGLALTTAQSYYNYIYIGGSAVARSDDNGTGGTRNYGREVNYNGVYLSAGSTIQFYAQSSAATTLSSSNLQNRFCIRKAS
ncbi:MAG: hypothetical protein AAGB31_11790 [Bdellovibrio sp.]